MLQIAVDWLIYSVLRLDPQSRLGATFDFFVYDAIKILALLFVLIAVIGFGRSFLSAHRFKSWIAGRKGFYEFTDVLFG